MCGPGVHEVPEVQVVDRQLGHGPVERQLSPSSISLRSAMSASSASLMLTSTPSGRSQQALLYAPRSRSLALAPNTGILGVPGSGEWMA